MKKSAAFLGVILIFIFVGYIENDDIEKMDTIVFSGTDANEEVDAPVEDSEKENRNLSLEMKLVKSEIVNGNRVETYREYEVYRDDVGNVVEEIPTDNYEYLEYWR